MQYERYRASPEFKKVHSTMSLEEFKFIFWMEYAHRWGISVDGVRTQVGNKCGWSMRTGEEEVCLCGRRRATGRIGYLWKKGALAGESPGLGMD